jgi:hypothetical protein
METAGETTLELGLVSFRVQFNKPLENPSFGVLFGFIVP